MFLFYSHIPVVQTINYKFSAVFFCRSVRRVSPTGRDGVRCGWSVCWIPEESKTAPMMDCFNDVCTLPYIWMNTNTYMKDLKYYLYKNVYIV